MIRLYERLPGNRTTKIAIATVLALVILTLVIWSYEVLGDLLDSGGTVGA